MASEPAQGTASACVDSYGSAIGMPQLCADWIPNQVFWLLVTLVAIYFILTRMALPRISGILAERAGSITSDLAAAETLRDKAKAAEAAYEKALADARAEAARIIGATRDELQAKLDEELARADAQIAERTAESERRLAEIRDSALSSVTEVAREAAADIAGLFGASVDTATVEAAVAERMKG